MANIIWYASGYESSCDILGDCLNKFSKHNFIKTRPGKPIPNGDIFIGSYRHFDDLEIYKRIYNDFGERNIYLFAHGISKLESQDFMFLRRNWEKRANRCHSILVSSHYIQDVFKNAGIRTQRLPFGVDINSFYQTTPIIGKEFGMAFAPGKGHRKGKSFALQQKDIDITFSNHKHKDMINFYNSIDCLLVLSEEDYRETFCLPILEAAACGRPVFSTKVGVASELIDYTLSCGYVGNKHEIIEFAKEITTEQLSEMGKQIYKQVRGNWSWEKIIKIWENYFES